MRLFTSLTILLLSCSQHVSSDTSIAVSTQANSESVKQETDSVKSGLTFKIHDTYNNTLDKINAQRKALAAQLKNSPSDESKKQVLIAAGQYFEKAILDSIMPHWYGTPWEFIGHTNTPGVGEVACGYLVSTTLRHMGVQVNRYKMAQQSAMSEAITLCRAPEEVTVFRDESYQTEISTICKDLEDGLYLVGLSNHVGYFLKRDGGTYFIHSDYVSGAVRFESAAKSEAFGSDIYCFAAISTNLYLMEKWLTGEPVTVHMD